VRESLEIKPSISILDIFRKLQEVFMAYFHFKPETVPGKDHTSYIFVAATTYIINNR